MTNVLDLIAATFYQSLPPLYQHLYFKRKHQELTPKEELYYDYHTNAVSMQLLATLACIPVSLIARKYLLPTPYP